MPTAPPRVCNRCKKPAPKNKPCQCRPAFEGSTHPGGDRHWRTVRANHLRHHPVCQHDGCRRIADEVDHVTPLAEGGPRFDPQNLMSLCKPHHQLKTTRDAQRGRTRKR